MADQTDQDIEFIPSDDIVEAEPAGAEDEAVHVHEREEPRGLMIVEAAEFDAGQLDESEAEELELDAEAEAEMEAAAEEEHEEDLEEVLQRHYGIVGAEPEEEPSPQDVGLRELAGDEFVCRSCFLRKAASQRSDPAQDMCVDCVANSAG